MWRTKNKWKVIIAALIVAVLAGTFYWGGNIPGARGWTVAEKVVSKAECTGMTTTTNVPENLSTEAAQTTLPSDAVVELSEKPAFSTEQMPTEQPKPTMEINPETGKDKYLTDPVPEGKPLPVEPQVAVMGTSAYTCTISISCAAILDNMDLCDPEKADLVPEDGRILKAMTVTFREG